MSLTSSFKAFREIYKDDTQLARLGAKRGQLIRLHYAGRLAARTDIPVKPRKLCFQQHGRDVAIELTPAYEGPLKSIFLDQEYECGHLLTRRPLRVLDLGANIGMAAVHFNTQFPGAQFVCVEPDPRNHELLASNLEGNEVNAQIVKAAVGAQPGSLTMRFGSDPTRSAVGISLYDDMTESSSVDVTTIPAVLSDAKWDDVDLLKIDIEGSEDDLLARNNEWLARVRAIIMEIHPNTSCDRLNGFLAPFGFNLRRVGDGREPVYIAARQEPSSPR